ncbi:acyl-CoA dehydrogenase [Roseixanthobacter glucoisosaccharinicivorans]|uniref:acyl-CoA dehydrogenase n=1 Tax=Roseixanthobacter glucoisosaccharinicivorans TaxID=3119923 RepID=UPI003728AF02
MTLAQSHPPAGPEAGHGDDILSRATAIAGGPLRAAVNRIDHGHYPLEILAELGGAGALGAHLARNGARFDTALAAMGAASRVCGATGFLMWAHDVCGLYMEQSDNPALMGRMLEDHAAGRTFGGTALSNPMKALAEIEPMLLRARKTVGGYLVSGTLPWVSHIAPGQYCGAIARVYRDDDTPSHEIMFILRCDPPVELRQCPQFSGMEGTSTFGIRLDDYFVAEQDLVADPARPFIKRIRGAFILLQAGMAVGVIQGAVDSMREVEPALGHVNRHLSDRPDEIQAELDELTAHALMLAQTPFEQDPDYFLDVLDTRAQGAELALRATQSALLHQGARGYLMSSAPQRRVREAHFIAIVTPAIKHLRWEMARLSREEMPA